MIQRIQTVYLALAVILLVLCCCMPLAHFEPEGMGKASAMYSIVMIDGQGAIASYLPSALLVLLVIAEVLSVYAIIDFKNRRRQMRTCRFAMLAEMLWLVGYAAILSHFSKDFTPHVTVWASFPLIAMILTTMARHAIKKDDDLVRSAERFR